MVNTLQQLLTDSVLANGVNRQYTLQAVRNYVNTSNQPRVKQELGSITSIKLLIELQAAGVPSWLSPTFFTIWANLQSSTGRYG